MNVCSVVVTYGNRFKHLKRVLEELIKQEIAHIIIIDNASIPESADQLKNFISQIRTPIQIHQFDENEGSALGFKIGIQLALKTSCEFIWILDDDNLPAPDALNQLKNFWRQQDFKESDLVALSSLRKDRQVFVEALQDRNPDKILWPKNSFQGFHFKQISNRLLERLQPKKECYSSAPLGEPMLLDVSFYGGLYFHRTLIDTIGLPNENLVLYSDDFHFTKNITSKGGRIWLLPDSQIADIDSPYYLPEKKALLYHSSLDGVNDAQVFYSCRNAAFYIKKYQVTNHVVYSINKYLFLTLITFLAIIRGKFKRLALIFKAIKHGENGRLGKVSSFSL